MIRLQQNQVYRDCLSVRYRAEAIMSEALEIKIIKERDYKDFSELAREQARAELRQDLWTADQAGKRLYQTARLWGYRP